MMKKKTKFLSLALVTLLCACNGLENTEPQDTELRLDIAKLTATVQDGADVADIAAVERGGSAVGYIVSFADGSGLTLMDLPEGGKVVTGLSEDSSNYYFEIEGGEKVTLPKAYAEPFKVEISGDEAELADGGTLTASYKVSGAGKGLEVTALAGEGWSAEITVTSGTEGTIKVTAPDPITTDKVLLSFKGASGKQVVRALRLTTKSAVQRGNIETYVFCGVSYENVDPQSVDYETALRRYREAAEAGVQIMESGYIWWDSKEWSQEALYVLGLAEKAGLKLALNLGRISWNRDWVIKMVNTVKDHPALWGYQVMDEPHADLFKEIADTRALINSLDGKHPCYINLNGDGGTFGPNGSYHTNNYEEYLDRYIAETDPDFLSFDVYPCFPDWVLDRDLYPSLELVAKKSQEAGIGFWAFAASCRFSDGYGLRCKPTLASLRFQDYTNLAYGAECLEYFTWATAGDEEFNFGDWPIAIDGEINTTNPTYEYVQTINREIQKRAFVYDGCRLIWVAHHNDIPNGCRPVDMSQLPEAVMAYSSESDLLLSLIENDGGKSEYLNFMSRTHLKSSKLHVRFRYPVQTVERDGSLKVLNPGDYDFVIDPGDILIVKTK